MSDNENGAQDAATAALPEAEIRTARAVSLFWLIPLLAAAIAGWLAWEAYSTRGPEITIVFKRGEGIEAGKTTIRYKAVEIGQVLNVGIAPDLKSIQVRARINLDFADHLTDQTRFWVVRPRVGASGISGLSTLVSGAFIEVDPAPGTPASRFTALEAPPIVPSDAPGRSYVLRARELGNVQPGSVLTFKDIEAGEVLGYELSDDGNEVKIHIFVREPYTLLVRENTRFWLASGLDLSVGADGLKFRTPSLQEVLLGGIKFDAPLGVDTPPAEPGAEFELFSDVEAIAEAGFTEQVRFVMYFDESIRGLSPGAPVEFRGIKLGEVSEIGLEIEQAAIKPQIPVVVNLHPQRLGHIAGTDSEEAGSIISSLIDRGLRARLQTGSLLTGQLYIDFALEPDTKAVFITGKRSLPQIPTLPTEFGEFKNNANALLAEFRRFPLAAIGERAVGALGAVEKRFDDPDIGRAVRAATASFESFERLAGEIETSFEPLRADLAAALATLREGSPTVLQGRHLQDRGRQHGNTQRVDRGVVSCARQP